MAFLTNMLIGYIKISILANTLISW